jgi:hypothetical protein
MQRFEMLFPPAMVVWLKAEAARRGVSIAEVIRGIIQEKMDKP